MKNILITINFSEKIFRSIIKGIIAAHGPNLMCLFPLITFKNLHDLELLGFIRRPVSHKEYKATSILNISTLAMSAP
jgi:hypothetical protein